MFAQLPIIFQPATILEQLRVVSVEFALYKCANTFKFTHAAVHPVAELAAFWNKPIVSWMASDPMFDDKSSFSTLGRTLGGATKLGNFLVQVFAWFNWHRIVVVFSTHPSWKTTGTTVLKVGGPYLGGPLCVDGPFLRGWSISSWVVHLFVHGVALVRRSVVVGLCMRMRM